MSENILQNIESIKTFLGGQADFVKIEDVRSAISPMGTLIPEVDMTAAINTMHSRNEIIWRSSEGIPDWPDEIRLP